MRLMFSFNSFLINQYKYINCQLRKLSAISSLELVNYLTSKELKEIETKWKEKALDVKSLDSDRLVKKGKKYVLSMFPYPSGNLHMGHVRVYAISDALARFYQMKGYEVIHPMGWDAFGLPAENAAFERGENPETWTLNNIENMKTQLKNLACRFDWSREMSTCDPKFYKWTQFIFLKLFHSGMAYRQEALVNWDPIDKTVLANEQVDENGCSWRSGAQVQKKLLTQWFIKTTKLSEELYEDLADPSLINWRDIPLMQQWWIGECNRYVIEMKVEDSKNEILSSVNHLALHLEDPVYINKIAFISLKTNHPLNKEAYVQSVSGEITLLNIEAVDPVNQRRIPLIICDSLECEHGSDIYVGIPSQKEIDESICVKLNFEIPLNCSSTLTEKEEILSNLVSSNCGGYKSNPKLKDWLISRQRFWGTPIPIIYCPECGTVPVPEADLPVELPKLTTNIEKGASVLKDNEEWYRCSCPRCGQPAHRETDTMDTFFDSSWYYLRFLDTENTSELVSIEKEAKFMPVDVYIGGKEHAILHLYYARFVQKILCHLGFATHKEPFKELLVQGMVKSRSYQVQETGKYLMPEEIDFSVSPPVEKGTKRSLLVQFEKMSKSKYNGIDPQSLLDEHGSDAVRLAILSKVGPQSERFWDENDLVETYKILRKVWKIYRQFVLQRQKEPMEGSLSKQEAIAQEQMLFESRNLLLIRATNYFEQAMQFHSVIRCLQQLCTSLLRAPFSMIHSEEYEKGIRCVLLILAPLCPHFASELWENVNCVSTGSSQFKTSIYDEAWPSVDPSYKMAMNCFVNEEDITTIRIDQNEFKILTEEKALELAMKNELLSPLISKTPILNVDYKHSPNYKATLHIYSLTEKQIRQAKALKKKEKNRKR